MAARTVGVVGGGIVGTALADELAGRGLAVTVLERDAGVPRGSTAFAPGFVGVHHDVPQLLELARRSAAVYGDLGAGFVRAGGLELATSAEGAGELERRVGAATAAGLPAVLDGPAGLPPAVADWVDPAPLVAVARFAADGVAVPPEVTAALAARAVARGARVRPGSDVRSIRARGGRHEVGTADGETLAFDDVVLAGGVWGPALAGLLGLDLPLVPVAHPYVYSAPRAGLAPGPFVRWPEQHVYARVHGDRLGIGSYDHRPVPVTQDDLADGAGLTWDHDRDGTIAAAQELLCGDARFTPDRRVNGVFAMTPDNLPFLGPVPGAPGRWVAQAIWVTHAAGAAAALADALLDGADVDPCFAVDRFDGGDRARLEGAALRLYRDIYAHDAA